MLFWSWLHPCYKIPEFFTIAPVLTSTLTVAAEIAAIRCIYIGLRVRYKYYKKTVISVWPPATHVLRPTSVFRTTIDVCKILFRSVKIWQGQKPVFE